MASVIANEFTEAVSDMHLSALIEIGLALFIVTIIVNAIARLLVWAVTRGTPRSDSVEKQTNRRQLTEEKERRGQCRKDFELRTRLRWLADKAATSLAVLVDHPGHSAAGRHLHLSHPQGRQFAQSRLLHARFPSRWANRAAAWPTPSSARSFCSASPACIGVPIGIGGGIYLAEFGRGTKLANAVRFTADVLNGVPSIVMGLAAYALIVVPQASFLGALPAAWRWAS